MEYNEIKKLLDRYFLAETTLEEESRLKDYFNTQAVHSDFEKYTPFFNSISEMLTLDRDFDEKVLAKLFEEKPNKIFRHNSTFNWLKIAAVFIILVASGVLLYNQFGGKEAKHKSITSYSPGKKSAAVSPDINDSIKNNHEAIDANIAYNKRDGARNTTTLPKHIYKSKPPESTTSEIKDTYADPDQAMQELEKSLAFISEKMNRGTTIADEQASRLQIINKIIETHN